MEEPSPAVLERAEGAFESLDAPEVQAAPLPSQARMTPAETGWRPRDFAMITFAVVGSGALTLALLMARALPPAAVAAAPAPEAPVKAAKPTPDGHTLGWTAANSAVWAGSGKASVAFELQADNTVPIWLRTVRPMLVVRCVSGRVDAFVFTASAARIEPLTDDHTVRYGFDEGSDVTERWPDSEEHDALFAPDGGSFVRQLTAARVLRFGFTPHNASPATAQFTVVGLASVIEPAARQCGWPK
ncbi:MAG: hypothetical protein ABIP65_00385 [Vicinamibacterales bacterium]